MEPTTITGPGDLYAPGTGTIPAYRRVTFAFATRHDAVQTLGLLSHDLFALTRWQAAAVTAAYASTTEDGPLSRWTIALHTGLDPSAIDSILLDAYDSDDQDSRTTVQDGDRPTDDQVDEIARALTYSYETGDYPPGLSDWAREFLGPDGGVLALLAEWRAERRRNWTVERSA